MHTLRDFPHISIPLPKRKIYKRLGYHDDLTSLDPPMQSEIEKAIGRAQDFIVLRGRALRLPITKRDGDSLELDNSLDLKSGKLAHFLASSEEALLMAATCGPAVMAEIKKQGSEDRQTQAVIYDAVASEFADAALGWIMELYRRELLHEGKYLLKSRYSAGYGDFKLENQILFYNLLKLDNMDISLTASFILVPEKTVTAVTGITAISMDTGDEA